jgi:hypothetical protein
VLAILLGCDGALLMLLIVKVSALIDQHVDPSVYFDGSGTRDMLRWVTCLLQAILCCRHITMHTFQRTTFFKATSPFALVQSQICT